MLEDKIIQFCAPTLARIKIGSMFGYNYISQEVFKEELCTRDAKKTLDGIWC